MDCVVFHFFACVGFKDEAQNAARHVKGHMFLSKAVGDDGGVDHCHALDLVGREVFLNTGAHFGVGFDG